MLLLLLLLGHLQLIDIDLLVRLKQLYFYFDSIINSIDHDLALRTRLTWLGRVIHVFAHAGEYSKNSIAI